MEEMSIADVMSEIPDEDLPFVSSVKDWIYMPAEFFQKWVRRPLECKKHPNNPKTENCQGAWKPQCLPPFLTNRSWTWISPSINGNLADNRALRAMVLHTKDDNTHQFLPMEEGGENLAKGLISALQKLKQVAPSKPSLTGVTWTLKSTMRKSQKQ